jgi:hypothetical protein
MSADPGGWVDAGTGADIQADTDEFVICAKFRFKSKEKEADKTKGKGVKTGSTSGADEKRERGRGREEKDGENADWIVLDMLEQNGTQFVFFPHDINFILN